MIKIGDKVTTSITFDGESVEVEGEIVSKATESIYLVAVTNPAGSRQFVGLPEDAITFSVGEPVEPVEPVEAEESEE